MAITRSQIARQLLAEGGAPRSPGNTTLQRVLPRMDGLRPGFYGPDMGEGGMESSFGAGTDFGSVDQGGESGGSDAQFQATAEALGTPQTPGITDNFRANQLKKQLDMMYGNSPLNFSLISNIFSGPKQEVYNKDFLDIDQLGMSGKDLTRSKNIQNALDEFQKTGRLSQSQFETAFGAKGPTTTPGGDNDLIPIIPKIPQLPTDVEPEKSDYDEFVQRFTLPERFRLAEGGEPRQAYGLGSIVKKVGRAVKKVAKSDIGKAALIGAAAFGIPGTQMGGLFGRKAIGGGATGLFGSSGIADFFSKQALFADKAGDIVYGDSPFRNALNFMKTPKGALTTIGGLTAATALLTPKQEEESESLSKRISDNTGLDINDIRKRVQKATSEGQASLDALKAEFPFLITKSAAKAEGGRIGFAEGTPQEMFPDNIDDIGPGRSEPKLRKMPEFKGDEVIPNDMMMTSAPGPRDDYDDIAMQLFGKGYKDLTPVELEMFQEELERLMNKFRGAKGGIASMAEGGMMNPNDEMLNMGGNEMDLRGGGFVPLGEYEKKDDVPARLSKNEFVFTADAVRAAGGGSVDRGADLMYKTMKQLENKVV